MKNFKRRILSIILLVSVMFSFASCQYIDAFFDSDKKNNSGYTGGFPNEPHFYGGIDIHWLETYEEAMEAIEHLKAYGNDINQNVISSYENEQIDAKYCIKVYTSGSKRLKKGQMWYDHKYSGVQVRYYGFLDKITIEELEHSDINFYKSFTTNNVKDEKVDTSVELYYNCESSWSGIHGRTIIQCWIVEKDTDNSVAELTYSPRIDDHLTEFPANFHDEVLKTLVNVGG